MQIKFSNDDIWKFCSFHEYIAKNVETEAFASSKQQKPLNATKDGSKRSCYFLMGIVNLTPNSFYDGGKFLKEDNSEVFFLDLIEKMINDGADILDLGGESTRPGALEVSLEDEKMRVIPKLKLIKKHFPHMKISVDTSKHEIANIACSEGADIINDVSGGASSNGKIFEVIKKHDVPIVVMHMRGSPRTMQKNLEYKEGVVKSVYSYFEQKLIFLKTLKVPREKVILDVGIGFGKSLQQNLELIQNQKLFLNLGCPLLIGASMKSMHQQLAGATITQRLPATLAVHLAALQNGANLFRVHDVLSSKQFFKAFLTSFK